jgi:glycosyltransferase involved in cell wall biosynthesis
MQLTEYPKNFWINKKKFFFLPYHTTIDKTPAEIIQGRYLFSGGNTARDYDTLLEAVKDLDLQVIIACDSRMIEKKHLPSNVEIRTVSHQEFRSLIEHSWINVISLKKGVSHRAGQQTFLNAMAMGKPVIVTDPEGAQDYIKHGHDGLLVPPQNPVKLKEAITFLIKNHQRALSMAQNAKNRAYFLNTETHFKIIIDHAISLTQLVAKDCQPQHDQ